jgi:hypothetical protein
MRLSFMFAPATIAIALSMGGAATAQRAFASVDEYSIPSAKTLSTDTVFLQPIRVGKAALPMAGSTIPASGSGDGCTSQPRSPSNYPYNYWDGWKYNLNQIIGGAFANIWNYSPWVYPTNGDFASAWSLLTYDHGYGGDDGYAQVGWIEYKNGERHTFEEAHDSGGGIWYVTSDFPTYAVNTYTYYDTLYNSTTGVISFRVNGTNGAHTWVSQTWIPGEAQVSAESADWATQMPGGYSSSYYHEDLFDSEYYLGGWKHFPSNAPIFTAGKNGEDESSQFGHTTPTSNNLSVWDKKCYY